MNHLMPEARLLLLQRWVEIVRLCACIVSSRLCTCCLLLSSLSPDMGGLITTVDGTSASGPVMAGLVSLLNDARLNAGLAPLGLLNPFLYQSAANVSASFFDVVVGTNKDGDIQPKCGAFPTFCADGFTAQPGWDPVTGLGTPNWAILKELALAAAKNTVRTL